MFNNICKSFPDIDQYFQSCTNGGLLNGELSIEKLSDKNTNDIIKQQITFAHLKTLFENTGYLEYVLDPSQLDKNLSRTKLSSSKSSDYSLPKSYNTVWITSKDNPSPINSDLNNFIIQSNKLDGYSTYIWTNIDPETLKELNPELSETNVIIKNIYTLETNYTGLLDFISSPTKYINPLVDKSLNGLLIDLSKYLIMESQGGILADLNFKFSDDFKENNLGSNNFIATYTGHSIENGFFVATPHHIIFKEVLDIIDEMINNPDCALKSLRENLENEELTGVFSMMPLFFSYIKYNNMNSNVDGLIFNNQIPENITMISYNITHLFEDYNNSTNIVSSSDEFISHMQNFMQHVMFCLDYNNSFILEPIGTDGSSLSWVEADIIN